MRIAQSYPVLILSKKKPKEMIASSLVFLIGVSGALSAGPVVTLTDGTQLQGGQDGSVSFFRGIPFAEPPLNDLRFAPPKPWTNSNVSVPLDATQHGHACMQFFWGDDGLFDDGSEDCLTLNVFVNLDYAISSSEPLPVGIFVHGGAFINGASFLPLYDGVDLMDYWGGKAILVTTNYRLNVFGFAGSEELRAQDPESGSTGNYGIQDQRLAFEWVRENIATFGGDPNRVTIFGESAGAGSMSAHLVMEKSKGLYNRVILESGAFSQWGAVTMSCAESGYQNLLKSAGCEDAGCLLQLSAKALLRASEKIFGEGCGYAPVVDGVELTTHPWILMSNGDAADVPMMYGTNTDEGAIFTVFPHDGTAEQLEKYWEVQGYSEQEIRTLNSLYVEGQNYSDLEFASIYWWAAQRSYGDDSMSCPSEYTSQQLGAMIAEGTRKSNIYFYHFEHTPRDACVTRHAGELQYVFHQAELTTRHEDDAKMADVMSTYWGNFISSGNPNEISMGSEELPQWDSYDADVDNVLIIQTGTDDLMSTHLKDNECGFAIPRIDAAIRSQFPPA